MGGLRFLADSILSQVNSATKSEVLHSTRVHRIEESDESDENASHDDARQTKTDV